MVTVLQCVKELGIAYSPLTLSVIGCHVAQYMRMRGHFIRKTWQDENGEWLFVNAYDSKYKDTIKSVILVFIQGKRDNVLLIKSRQYTWQSSNYGFVRYIKQNLKRI